MPSNIQLEQRAPTQMEELIMAVEAGIISKEQANTIYLKANSAVDMDLIDKLTQRIEDLEQVVHTHTSFSIGGER